MAGLRKVEKSLNHRIFYIKILKKIYIMILILTAKGLAKSNGDILNFNCAACGNSRKMICIVFFYVYDILCNFIFGNIRTVPVLLIVRELHGNVPTELKLELLLNFGNFTT